MGRALREIEILTTQFSRKFLTFWAFALLLPSSIHAQNQGRTLLPEVDAYLRSVYPADEPGAAVIVMRGGKVIHRSAYGMADLELGVLLSPDMVFQIGSLTKQFTAAAILILQQRGKLSINDPVTKYFPEFPAIARKITLQNLLTHTSGLLEYAQVENFRPNIVRQDTTPTELLRVFRDKPLYFEPGDEYRYNNSGYAMLGAIIELLSGDSYADFVRDEIFLRLGMKNTQFGGSQIVPGRVSGYSGSSGSYQNAGYVSPTQPYAAGALMSTLDDLARWDHALVTGAIPGVSYESMGKRFALNDGTEIDYGYGLAYMDIASREVIGHGGGYSGFTALSFRIPDHDVYVALLINAPGKKPNRSEVANNLVAIVVRSIVAETGD